MKTIHLRATLENLILMHASPWLTLQPQVCYGVGSCIIYVGVTPSFNVSGGRANLRVFSSPLPSPASISIAPLLCFIALIIW